jgi:hypothetical protein
MARKALRYSWARKFKPADPELAWLSHDALAGLDYAQQLAENARERSLAALLRDPVPERLTVADLATSDGTSPVIVHRLIKQTRLELFGKELSQSAIYYRLKTRAARQSRSCAEDGCNQPLPPTAPASRRYCDQHRTTAARVRRHRRRPAA